MNSITKYISLIAIALLQPLSADNPAYIHPITKIEIPSELGPFSFLQGDFSANPEIGSILAFKSNISRDSQMTLYIHKMEMKLSEQVEDSRAAIKKHKDSGSYSVADLKETTKISANAYRFTGYLEAEDINDPSDVTKLQTYALFVKLGEHTLKIRISSLKGFKLHDQHCMQLETAVLGLIEKQKQTKAQ